MTRISRSAVASLISMRDRQLLARRRDHRPRRQVRRCGPPHSGWATTHGGRLASDAWSYRTAAHAGAFISSIAESPGTIVTGIGIGPPVKAATRGPGPDASVDALKALVVEFTAQQAEHDPRFVGLLFELPLAHALPKL